VRHGGCFLGARKTRSQLADRTGRRHPRAGGVTGLRGLSADGIMAAVIAKFA
jgi:hypothetical protein